jgi:hypothetical protein
MEQFYRDAERLSQVNAAAIEAETRLGVAMNRVGLVEGRLAFREKMRELSQLAWRDLPPNAVPAAMPALEVAYVKRVEPLIKVGVKDFMDSVIRAHHFRGYRAEHAARVRPK